MGLEADYPNPIQARRLGDFADHRADGLHQAPHNDIEETCASTEAALGPTFRATTALPEADRQAIWEQIMHVTAGSFATEPNTAPIHLQAPPAMRRSLPQWHAALSLVAVLAFLATIVGIAYQRIPDGGPERVNSSPLSGQVVYDANDASTYIQMPAQCTTNDGTFTSDEELATRSMADWPDPLYTPVQPVTPEVGNAVLQTYLRYLRCNFEGQEAMNWSPGTPVTYQDVIPLTSQSWLSERYRYGAFLYESLPPTEQDAVDAFYCRPRAAAILQDFPLPVNHHVDMAVLEQTVDGIPTITNYVFAPSDVYRLPDGRYGAIVGSVSAADLLRWITEPAAAATPVANGGPSPLLFVAFTEREGAYYIDEEFTVSGIGNNPPFHDATMQCDGTIG